MTNIKIEDTDDLKMPEFNYLNLQTLTGRLNTDGLLRFAIYCSDRSGYSPRYSVPCKELEYAQEKTLDHTFNPTKDSAQACMKAAAEVYDFNHDAAKEVPVHDISAYTSVYATIDVTYAAAYAANALVYATLYADKFKTQDAKDYAAEMAAYAAYMLIPCAVDEDGLKADILDYLDSLIADHPAKTKNK
jgi:hypothetical protein